VHSPQPEPIFLDADDPRIVRAAGEGNRKQRRREASIARRVKRMNDHKLARSSFTARPGVFK
jgi:hypothetical protein